MKDHSGCIRAYIRSSKAWYADLNRNVSITIGMYHPDGGTSGEFEVEWVNLNSFGVFPQLKCFEDSWNALSYFGDLLGRMSDVGGENISEPDFCKILDSLGISDITEYERPGYR